MHRRTSDVQEHRRRTRSTEALHREQGSAGRSVLVLPQRRAQRGAVLIDPEITGLKVVRFTLS